MLIAIIVFVLIVAALPGTGAAIVEMVTLDAFENVIDGCVDWAFD